MQNALVYAGITVALVLMGFVSPGGLFASENAALEGADATEPSTTQARLVAIPSVINKPVSVAPNDINEAGLTPVVKSVVDRQHPPGIVAAQSPIAGAQVPVGSLVTLNVAATEIAIQPGTTVDEATGRIRTWGQLLVHRAFTLDLKAQAQHVPMLAISYQGKGYVRGDESEASRFAEARAEQLAERLTLAWTLLDSGGTLEISMDEASIWQLTDSLGLPYEQPQAPQHPLICVCHPSLGSQPLKVMAIYPEDALSFGQPDNLQGVPTPLTPRELADYLVALFQAHHLLFHKQSTDPNSYDQLEICRTRDGRIFKDIAGQIRQAEGTGTLGIQAVLEQMPVLQATRLATLAHKAPADWRLTRKP